MSSVVGAVATPREAPRLTGWLFALVLVPLHLLAVSATVGLRVDHFIVDSVSIALFCFGPRLAYFGYLAIPLWIVGALYETLLPAIMPLRGAVHVADLYAAELAWFGLGPPGAEVVPTVWITRLLHPALDLYCGTVYVLYLPVVFAFAGYLYLRRREHVQTLTWAFLLVNLMGMSTWVLLPAAPPWYVDHYGLGPAVMDALPSAARAARFDAVTGTQFFASFYARSVNVFGAMPSLHCAYPMLVVLVARAARSRLVWPAAAFALSMAFSAVYLNHHYVLDALMGYVYAAAAFGVVWGVRRALG